MKKFLCLIFMFALLLSGCSLNNQNNLKENSKVTEDNNADYVKSVWITYYELKNLICDTEKQFRKKFSSVISELSEMGFNTVTVQVRPCGDAFYFSDFYPSSRYCFGKQGSDMPYDPLEIMCEIARKNNFKIEAWINPYRVSQNNNTEELCDANYAKIWLSNKKTESYVYFSDKGIYFNPSVDEVTNLIVNGVKEIVKNYSVDAIHFDDYFYPTTDSDIDKIQYEKYKENGGTSDLSTWRREKVDNMVSSVYKAVKSVNKTVKFGISPASDVDNNYNKLYADVVKWCTDEGYVDYICPQIYFGFKNTYQPFMFTVKKWTSIAECDLYVGLPLYKAGKKDEYASNDSKESINEFVNNNNIISRQIVYLSKISSVKGFYVFSYSSLHSEKASVETENMINVMRSSNPE